MGISVRFTMDISSGAFGTDTLVTVRLDGKIVGKRDPFFPHGIPSSKADRNAAIASTVRAIIDDADLCRGCGLKLTATGDCPEFV